MFGDHCFWQDLGNHERPSAVPGNTRDTSLRPDCFLQFRLILRECRNPYYCQYHQHYLSEYIDSYVGINISGLSITPFFSQNEEK